METKLTICSPIQMASNYSQNSTNDASSCDLSRYKKPKCHTALKSNPGMICENTKADDTAHNHFTTTQDTYISSQESTKLPSINDMTIKSQSFTNIAMPDDHISLGWEQIVRGIILLAIWLVFAVSIWYNMYTMPDLGSQLQEDLYDVIIRKRISFDMEINPEWQRIIDGLESYRILHSFRLQLLIAHIYVFYQSFPLLNFWAPGTATTLTILFGAIFGVKWGFIFCSTMATIGPAVAYWTVSFAGYPLVMSIPRLRKSLSSFIRTVNIDRLHQFDLFCLIFLARIAPLVPNVMLNITAPLINCPFNIFLWGTLVGLLPNTLLLLWIGFIIRRGNSLSSYLFASFNTLAHHVEFYFQNHPLLTVLGLIASSWCLYAVAVQLFRYFKMLRSFVVTFIDKSITRTNQKLIFGAND